MGQLLDRLRNYVRSSVASRTHTSEQSWADRIVESEDDELRRIIEELSREGAPASGNHDTRSGRSSSYQRREPPTDLPADVLMAHTALNIPVTADTQAIRKAYKAAITRWHPDRHVSATAEQQALAQRRAREINDAYATLKKFYSIP